MGKIVYEKETNEIAEENGLDLSLFKKRSSAKTFPGLLIGDMKKANNDGNRDVAALIQHYYKKYMDFQKTENVHLQSWKGKSGIKFIEKPDYFIAITHQKKDQDSEPQEVKREITKQEVNKIINCINRLNEGKLIPTRDIGEMAYNKRWDQIFADRPQHTELNLILRLLDYLKIIEYRGGTSAVLMTVREVQECIVS